MTTYFIPYILLACFVSVISTSQVCRFVKLIAVEKYKEAINILAIRFVAEQLTAVKYTHFVANE